MLLKTYLYILQRVRFINVLYMVDLTSISSLSNKPEYLVTESSNVYVIFMIFAGLVGRYAVDEDNELIQ